MASLTVLRAVRLAPDGLDLRFQARLRVELARSKRSLANPDSTLALVARFLVCDLGVRGLGDDATANFFALFVGFARKIMVVGVRWCAVFTLLKDRWSA